MKRSKKILLAGLILMLAACGGKWIIVNKQAAEEGKRIAIYSAYSNRVIYNKGGGGSVTALMSLAKSATRSDKATAGPNNLLSYSYDKYAAGLEKLNGWQVMPKESLLQMSGYKERVGAITKNQKNSLFNADYFGLEGLFYHDYDMIIRGEDVKKICEELDVDAIAYIGMDYAYKAWTAIGGMGSAKADVATRIVLINKKGQRVLDTANRVKKGSGMRHMSDSKFGLVGGNMMLNAKTEEIFKEAIDKAIADVMKQIDEGLKG